MMIRRRPPQKYPSTSVLTVVVVLSLTAVLGSFLDTAPIGLPQLTELSLCASCSELLSASLDIN